MSPPPQPAPPRTTARVTGLVTGLAVLLLTALCTRHPGLRLVDFLGFSARGHRMLAGSDLVHPLYPSGYPFLVGILQAVGLPPLWAGKLLTISAAATSVAVVTRWLGPVAGLWLLVQPAFLTFGSTEGTDLPAFAAGVAAIALRSTHRPLAAGACLGGAVLLRYTSAALLPIILWPPTTEPHRLRSLFRTAIAFGLCTLPHWGVALATGSPLLPDQSSNFAIGASTVVRGFGMEVLTRIPESLTAALPFVFSGPGVGLGLVALVGVGLWELRQPGPGRSDAALRLGSWGAIHLLLVATAFANTRLVLPTRLAFALGVALLLQSRPRLLAAVSLLVAVWTLPASWSRSPGERNLAGIVEVLEQLDGPLRTAHFLTTDPWVYRTNGSRLDAGTPLREAGGDPRALDAQQVATFARSRGDLLLVIDVGRVQRTYPGLHPLLETTDAARSAGLQPVGRSPGYRVFAVQERP